MVVIRLSRAGAKKRPFYQIVVTDSRKRRNYGDAIKNLGYFNPVARGQELRLNIDMEQVSHWISVGAQMSDRVRSLVKEYKKANTAN